MLWVVVRRVVLLALLVGAAVSLAVAGLPDVCSRQLLADASSSVEVCEPMSMADPRVVLFLLFVGLLLLPELSELEVGGVLTVRRQVREVKEEVVSLKDEVAYVRSEVLTAAAAASNASASVVANVDVHPERTVEVTRAIEESVSPDDGDFDVSAVEGAHAISAFDAGFYGLTRYVTEQFPTVVLAGYVFNEVGTLELYSFVSQGEVSVEVEDASEFYEPPPLTGTFRVKVGLNAWSFSAPARDDAGGIVGALRVRIASDSSESSQVLEELAAQVELMAGSYARLLIDILGEVPRESTTGEVTRDETQ